MMVWGNAEEAENAFRLGTVCVIGETSRGLKGFEGKARGFLNKEKPPVTVI